MIPTSPFAWTGAGLTALALHLLIALALPSDEARIAGGLQAGDVGSIGTSFADMAVGTLDGDPEDVAETIEPVVPDEISGEAPSGGAPPEAVAPASADIAQGPSRVAVAAVRSVPSVSSAVGLPLAPEPPRETVTGSDIATAVLRSERPQARPDRSRQRTSQQPAPAPRGNTASRREVAGSAQGVAETQARSDRSGQQGRAAERGTNAAATNYRGEIKRRLQRVRRPNVRASGSARVAFVIADSGNLAAVSISRSSGNPSLDRAAIELVRRAAPFPPPPPGARRDYDYEVEGRL
ncbi:TonB family protein [Aestuariibius sp. 2305UL40-4]|uniref:TonB family protein n=1 Tax=Aestuariibius violaceus TaxID=3234132 RepID=UPI00345EF761